jgi:regulator of protease activity HflC (stomatin/prohibitin superfamily)
MNRTLSIFAILFFSLFLSNCAIIQPGEVGVKQRFGKFINEPVTQGMIVYNPFFTQVITASTQTRNILLTLNLPSREGLSVRADISILYRLEPNKFMDVITNYGTAYEPIIIAIFNSAASDVCANYYAKDMHSGKRAEIEAEIRKTMYANLDNSGLIVEAVLMKSITLPPGLASSIEQKLKAEQDAMRMEFILQQEKLEADRKLIQAKGSRDAQLIQAEGLTPEILRMKALEVYEKLSKSPNAKIIITNGDSPIILGQ